MPLRIVIDGYNLIRQSSTLRSFDSEDISRGREKLIDKLAHYRRFKHHPVLVVFDGWQEGHLTEQRTKEKGIDIVYSKRGEKADAVIKRFVSNSQEERIVVTSDRDIANFCKSRRCEVIDSRSFDEKMEFSLLAGMKGIDENDDEKTSERWSTKKKGPAKKLPKSQRKRMRRMKKL